MNNTNMAGSKTVKLMKHYVTDGVIKARVAYSKSTLYSSNEEAITLYAKTYDDGRRLALIFKDAYENNTDTMTDYFEKGLVRIMPNNPMFAAALARCQGSRLT